ncbi:NDR1/HIN1-like protein 10 [Phaseolus vulgaris]|uniref:NDR1/HIN1-like protein 10 n=1 Tax=Phaseolus vulgaris TaxID=3885 RepID=UPI0035CC39C7
MTNTILFTIPICFFVKNATLTSFTYTNTTLHYNLTLQLSIPSKFTTLDYINVVASYNNITFASQPDETLIEGFTGLSIHFNGERVLALSANQHSELDSDNMSGIYNISVKFWPSKKISTPTKVLCDLQIPMNNSILCDWIKD